MPTEMPLYVTETAAWGTIAGVSFRDFVAHFFGFPFLGTMRTKGKLTGPENQMLIRLKQTNIHGIPLLSLWTLARQPESEYPLKAVRVLRLLESRKIGVVSKHVTSTPQTVIVVYYLPVILAHSLAIAARNAKGEVLNVQEIISRSPFRGTQMSPLEILLYVDAIFASEFVCDIKALTINYPNKTQRYHLTMKGKGAVLLQDVVKNFTLQSDSILGSPYVHVLPVSGVHKVAVYSEELIPRDESFRTRIISKGIGKTPRIITRADALKSARQRMMLAAEFKSKSISKVHKRKRVSMASKIAQSRKLARQKINAVYIP